MKAFLLLEHRTWGFFLDVYFLCYGLEIRLWVFSVTWTYDCIKLPLKQKEFGTFLSCRC